jgi:phosphatidate cytidylyltransferase
MKRVLTAVVLIPLVLLVVFRAPLWLFALVVAGIVVLALQEYLNIAELAGAKPFQRLSYAMALLFVYLIWRSVAETIGQPDFSPAFSNAWWMILLLGAVIFGIPLVFRKDLGWGLVSAASSFFGVLYTAASLGLLVVLRATPFQRTLVVFALFSVWAGDIAAYYVGKNIGKHKLAPVVSPNKSWEGAVASVLASVVVACLVFQFRSQIDSWFAGRPWVHAYWLFPEHARTQFAALSWLNAIALGLLTNVAAQFGDLFESALKRGAGVKDSGTLLPGHGGILDRIDALLFAIPVVWCYANLSGLFVKWTFYKP